MRIQDLKTINNAAQLADNLQHKYDIFGVFWNKGSSPTLTRTDMARGATATAGTDAILAYNEFDMSAIFKDFTIVTDSYGNVFVRIPKMYTKKVDGNGYKTRQVSRKPFTGAYLPCCFWDFTNNKELDYVDVGKHKANLSADTTKLESKPNAYPLINKNIVDFRTLAKANNINAIKGYQQLDIHVMDLLQTLFTIEFATLNSQSVCAGYTSAQYAATHLITVATTNANTVIVANATAALYKSGQTISIGTTQGGNERFYGRTITAISAVDTPTAGNTTITFDGAPVSLLIGDMLYNTGYKNGFSAGIAASVGSINSNTNGLYPFVWHGIESIFGDLYQWVDGVNINERQAWVCANADNYASNVFASPYQQLGYINGSTDGNPISMGYDANLPFAEFPITVGGSSSTYYADYYFSATGQRVASVGGLWCSGSYAGLFFWDLTVASSGTRVNVGSRLIKKAVV